MASLFGANWAYDAFVLGFRIPNLMRDLFAEGGLSSAFVPIFTRYLTTSSREETLRLYNLVRPRSFMIVGAFARSAWPSVRNWWILFAHGFPPDYRSMSSRSASAASCFHSCCWSPWRRSPWGF